MNDAVKLPLATVAATLAVALAVFTFRAATLPSREQQPNADTGSVTPAPEFRIGIVTDIHGRTGKQYDYRFMDPDKVMRPIYYF